VPHLNPTPIHEIEERWISGFDKPRLQAINLKSLLETGEVLPQAPWEMSRAHA
jgi:hypothetical protein